MMNQLRLLISDALDRKLDDAEAEQLEQNLRDDPAALDRYVLSNFIHSHLIDWLGHEAVGDDALAGLVEKNGASVGLPQFSSLDDSRRRLSKPAPPAPRYRKSAMAWTATLAASILIAASVAMMTYIASRPIIVGQLTQADACKWKNQSGEIPVGTLLEAGQPLELVEGRALVTLASGAQVLLQAPTSLRLDSAMEVQLQGGEIATKVPTHAIGFTVTSSLARFIDLGTQFTLKLDRDKAFELYVFEGLVEVQMDQRFGDEARRPLRVAQVRAVRFDTATGIDTLPFNEGQQMPF